MPNKTNHKVEIVFDAIEDIEGNLYLPISKARKTEYDAITRNPTYIKITKSPTTGKGKLTAQEIYNSFPIHTILTPEQYNHRKVEYLKRYGYISGAISATIGKRENRKEILANIILPEYGNSDEFTIYSNISGKPKHYKKLSELLKEITDTRYDALKFFKEYRTDNTLKTILQQNETELLAKLFEDGIIVKKGQ